jgi:hypothetical protein
MGQRPQGSRRVKVSLVVSWGAKRARDATRARDLAREYGAAELIDGEWTPDPG